MDERDFSIDKSNMIKAIAIMGLLCHHMFGATFLESHEINQVYIFPQFTNWVRSNGQLSIYLFAMVSGYGIAASMKNKTIVKTVWDREIGLLSMFVPVYILAFIALIVTEGFSYISNIYSSTDLATRTINVLCDMLGLSGQYYNKYGFGMLNRTWWYMCAAHYIILTVPFIVMIMKKHNKSGYILWILFGLWLSRFPEQSVYYSCCFAAIAGACFYEYRICERIDSIFNKGFTLRLLEFVLVLGVLVFYFTFKKYQQMNAYFYMSLFAPVWFIVVESFISRIPFVSNGLAWMGRYGGLFYMTHTLVYSKISPTRNYIYHFKYAVSSYVAAFVITMGICVMIKLVMKKTGYFQFVKHLKEKCNPQTNCPVQ